jgi:hypothetical protein
VVVARKVDSRGTWFRAMNYEEQVVQGIGQCLEAAVAYELEEETNDSQEDIEVAKTHQGSPIQIRVSLEVQMAQESGTLLHKQAQLLMKQMQDDPYLAISPGIPTSVQSVTTGSSGPGPIGPDNTNGLGNLKSMTPPIDPSEEGTTQPKTGQVSIETQAPNPLSTLIHIYNDNEILEPPSGTPICIQEESGPEKTPSPSPEKTSSPRPEDRDEGVQQKEAKAKGGLNVGKSNEPEIDVGPSDEPVQKEIDSSTTDEKVSDKSIPDTSIIPNTQIPGEKQVEVGSTRQNKEVREPTLEQIYTAGSLGNNLTWGDQQILDLVDEVTNIYVISYDQKRKAII